MSSSSPIDNVDDKYIVGEVALLRVSAPEKTCLLVEGQDDHIIYKRFVDTQNCQITICYGKENLVRAIEILNQQVNIKGYLGIKDADFDVINNMTPHANLLLTDGHDLEVMICTSPALEKYVDLRLKSNTSFVDIISQEVRIKLFKIGAVVGYVRWLSYKNSWGIKIHTNELLKPLSEDGEISIEECINEVKYKHSHIDESKCNKLEFDMLVSLHLIHICSGHELVTVLGTILPIVAKRHLKKKITPGIDIAGSLMLAYEHVMFKATKLFRDIQLWEQNNIPFKILSS